MSAVTLQNARLACYRIYDVAEELKLTAAEAILSEHAVTRASFRRVKPEHLQVAHPPIHVKLGRATLKELPLPLTGDITLRAYATGVVSVALWLELPAGMTLDALCPVMAAAQESVEITALALERVNSLLPAMGDAVVHPRQALKVMEEYTVLVVTEFDQPMTADALLKEPALPLLLLGESGEGPALSDAQRQAAISKPLSYYRDDLTLVEWNAAVVFDPRGAEDVADILEFTAQQLVEFRYYDEHLDEQMERTYDKVALHVQRGPGLFGGSYTQLARELMLLRVELTEVTEKLDNGLKLVGEPFLARVYLAAVDRFRIPQWRVSVEEKLKVVDNLVSLVRGEINTGKSVALELAVVFLILVEIVMGFLKLQGH